MTQRPVSDRAANPSKNKSDQRVTVSTFPELCWAEESLESLFEKVKRAKQDRTEKGQIISAVSDEGIGIPPDKLPKLFERFYQVDGSSTRRFGGMGIGLALCSVIVKAHGRRIWAESAGEGRGSTLYIAFLADGRKEVLDGKGQTNSKATDQTPLLEV